MNSSDCIQLNMSATFWYFFFFTNFRPSQFDDTTPLKRQQVVPCHKSQCHLSLPLHHPFIILYHIVSHSLTQMASSLFYIIQPPLPLHYLILQGPFTTPSWLIYYSILHISLMAKITFIKKVGKRVLNMDISLFS